MATKAQKQVILPIASIPSVKMIDGGHMLAVDAELGDGSQVVLLVPTKLVPDLIVCMQKVCAKASGASS